MKRTIEQLYSSIAFVALRAVFKTIYYIPAAMQELGDPIRDVPSSLRRETVF